MNALLTPSPCPSPLKGEGTPPMHGRISDMTPSPRAGEGWREGDERPVNTLSLSLSPQGTGGGGRQRGHPPPPWPSPLKGEGMPPMHGRIRHMTPSPRAGEGWGEGDERPVNTLSLSLSPQGRGNATHARAYPSHDPLPPCGGGLGRGG